MPLIHPHPPSYHQLGPVRSSIHSHFKRTEDVQVVAFAATLGGVVFIVLSVFLLMMYRQMRWERVQSLIKKSKEDTTEKKPDTEPKPKPELACDSSVARYEMDGREEPRELPEKKEGRPHEVPGVEIVPIELPGDMPPRFQLQDAPYREKEEDQLTISKIT
ncbi:hypothetical protein GGS20DRAFT_581717 [Poronia punctata]|nr:hypothetical protein GGS20DRAFT_581717 [Poronia punctata]